MTAPDIDLTRRALPGDPRPRPWAIFRYGRDTLYLPVLEAAKNYADKAYPVGPVEIEHIENGEQWKRRGRQWVQTKVAQQPELALQTPEDRTS